MNHVWPVGFRFAGKSLQYPPWNRNCATLPNSVLRLVRVKQTSGLASRSLPFSTYSAQLIPKHQSKPQSWKDAPSKRCFHASVAAWKAKYEKGLKFRAEPLTRAEVEAVFGPDNPGPVFANRLLRVLYGRMVDGTLDLPPPEDVQRELERHPDSLVPSAIQWLQSHYPIDEEEAIQRRLRREEISEEQQSPSQLMQRAEDLGLYKPQSGHYHAPLSEKEGDPFGRSEIDRIRAENIAQAEKEEQALEQQIQDLMSQVQAKREQQAERDTALTSRSEQGLETSTPGGEIRPPNEFEKWILRAGNRASTKLTLESPEVAQMSMSRRLLPSLLFTAAVSLLCYAFAQNWDPPRRSERLMPNTSLGSATIVGLVAINVLIWWAWKFPPAWRILNRYFITVPGQPRPFSMLGSFFSHQTRRHLFNNLFYIIVPGICLHEDVGRGTFLAIFIASGIWASWTSLATFVARGVMVTSTLGASGAAAGVLSAYFVIHFW